MSGGLIPAHEGSGRLTVDREALVERWVENFGLSGEWELRIAQQEAEHVAGLVEAAVRAERQGFDGAMHSVWLHGQWRWLTRNMTTEEREAAADAVERHWATYDDDEAMSEGTLADLRWWRQ